MAAWAHLGRGLGFAAIAVAALVGSVSEGQQGIRLDFISVLRILGYFTVLAFLPRALRLERGVWLAFVIVVVGEWLLLWQGNAGSTVLLTRPSDVLKTLLLYLGVALLDLGVGYVGARILRALLRVRLIDRLVIVFAVFGLLLAQLVAALVVGVVYSFSFHLSGPEFRLIMGDSSKPLELSLTAILLTSALIGYFLARDLTSPISRFGRALRAIGKGDFDARVQLRQTSDDEMHDLARELNRMAQRLKSAESLRNEFFSFVSHELRSPLTAIRGFVATLESFPDFSEEDRTEIYAIMHEESDRLLRMIGELLDLSRIQSGKPLSVQRERFDAGRHVRKVIGIMTPSSNIHEIEAHVPSDPVWLVADPDKFDQILINLLSNALKYSPGGGIVEVTLEEQNETVSVAVADPGVGMTPEQTRRVFEKFYRVSEQESAGSSLSRVEGSGLGLYLTRALVEAHGGRISVKSQLGEGSVFTVRFPRQVTDDEMSRSGSDASEAPTNPLA
jgi:signal transduction histidine kinase